MTQKDSTLPRLMEEIVAGRRLSYEEALELLEGSCSDGLLWLGNKLRETFKGNKFDTCSILNARSGRCSEDCKWCSQSAHHRSEVDIYPLVSKEQALKAAKHNAERGIRRFSLVTSGRTMNSSAIERSAEMYRAIGDEYNIELCASMGLLNREQLQSLYDSGVRRYHCNLETAPSFFPNLCSTHTIEEKIATIKHAQEMGMEVCSGGILGMGESMEHRVELAITLRELGIRSIPLNLLNPIEGTKLENQPLLEDDEVLRSVAIFRILNPDADIRLAGGRILYKHLERSLLRGGVSASIMGDMLTTSGAKIDEDRELFLSEGFEL